MYLDSYSTINGYRKINHPWEMHCCPLNWCTSPSCILRIGHTVAKKNLHCSLKNMSYTLNQNMQPKLSATRQDYWQLQIERGRWRGSFRRGEESSTHPRCTYPKDPRPMHSRSWYFCDMLPINRFETEDGLKLVLVYQRGSIHSGVREWASSVRGSRCSDICS